MSLHKTLEKLILGKPYDALGRVPTHQETIDRYSQTLLSTRPLRSLGLSALGEVLLTEEDRESHIHILGSPGEGKSKFLELLLRQDIDSGYGACLLDPSDNGDTLYKVLKYAISRGHRKIVLIDPHDIRSFNAVPTINPIHYKAPAPAVTGSLMDSIRVLWATKDFAETPRIQKFLPAVFACLHAGRYTLAECRYFMEQWMYKARRDRIVDTLHPYDIHRVQLEQTFRNVTTFEQFQSTVNRLMPILDPTLELILGSNETPMSFLDLVSQGYLVLVNLDSEGLYGREHQRLLGTLVINEILYALQRLRAHGWQGVYYLYIDECGDYATPKLAQILDKKRKSGLRLTLSHQRVDQFTDKEVASAIYGGCKIKVLFNTASRDDRDRMIRMMYGGELRDRDVSFALSQLRKQHAVIKINKQPPTVTRIPDLPDVKMSAEQLGDWKEQHYKSYPWYRSIQSVREEINKRFALPPSARQPASRPRSQSDKPVTPTRAKPERKGASTVQNEGTKQREDSASLIPPEILDDIPDSPPILRGKTGRPAGKGKTPPPTTK